MWEPFQYLTIDPGKTNGWAVWKPVTMQYQAGQIPYESVWKMLEQSKYTYELDGPLIVERFNHRQGMPNIDHSPIEVIGVIKEWARQNQWHIHWHNPAQKEFFKDEILKKHGLWIPGKPHAMDALRHLLYFRKEFRLAR
jgi:hypothetical protein